MSTVNERRLLTREWVNMQPAVVAYREQCIKNMSSHERYSLLKTANKLTECRKSISEAQKHSRHLKYYDDENKEAKEQAKDDLREKWDNLRKVLDSVRRSERLSDESKAILAVDFISHTEARGLSRIAMKVLPDNVLFSWVAFNITAPDVEGFKAFSEREHISFVLVEKLQRFDNYIRVSQVLADAYENIVFAKVSQNEPLLDKINVLLLYIDYVRDFYGQSAQRATEVLKTCLEPFKEENNIEGVPDDWAIGIAQQMWKEPEQQ